MPQNTGLSNYHLVDSLGSPTMSATQLPVNQTLEPTSPLDQYLQMQLLQRNVLLSTQLRTTDSLLTNRSAPRLERSVSEPFGPQDRNQSQSKHILNPNRYKTEMCRPYDENGYCKYGDKCQFAHGSRERRNVPRHPKYKTEFCKTFHTTGICPYGPRCHFIHNEDEYKLDEIAKKKHHQATMQAAQEMAKQAAYIQLQHQLLQNQLHSLVSQVNQQLVSQVDLSALNSPTQPLSIDRPRLTHSISVHPTFRGFNLGSTSETPPESLSTSPILSPTTTSSEDSVSDSFSDSISGLLTPPVGGDFNTSFCFPAGDMSPLQMSSQKQMTSQMVDTPTLDTIASLSASLQALALKRDTFESSIEERFISNIESVGAQTCEKMNRLPVFNNIASQ